MIISNEAKSRLTAWWNHEDMDRPCFHSSFTRDRELIPDTDDLEKYWTDVDFRINRRMALIDHTDYFFEGVPAHYVDFGSVPLGGCLGGELLLIDKRTTWNKPFINSIEDILSLDVSPDNKWWSLIKRVAVKSAEKARNHHYVSYPAFSGISDIISAVFGIEAFMYELVDNPEGIKKASSHLIDVWTRLFKEFAEIVDSTGNDGFVASWPGIWSPGRSFPLQEDVSYMLSKEMFDEFCLPCIDALSQVLEYPYYHLDGIGALKFVDSLLGIEKLKVIQWIPGAGHEEMSQWHDLLGYIISHGKSVHVEAKEEEIEPLIKAVGSKGLLITAPMGDKTREKYGG